MSHIGERRCKSMDFERIYNTYFNEVYLFTLKLSGDQTVAEEIAQETFFKALQSFSEFKGNCKVSVWLCQIAKNTYFSHLQKGRRYQEANINGIPSQDDLTETLICKENALIVHKTLHNLKEPYKEVFTLRVFGELSYKDISNIFEKTESWARVTYYRAKSTIKDLLKEELK